MRSIHLLLSLLCYLVREIIASGGVCPNDCSRRGRCNEEGVCICEHPYTAAPDCSLKMCPFAQSWSGKPYGLNMAHRPSECSNNGLCDRKQGICKCFEGFTGHACERSLCECNGHGVCATMETMYESLFPAVYDGDYKPWEGNKTTGCICDEGYTGPGCTMRMCPKGDDPLTPFTDYPSIVIRITQYQRFTTGNYKFTFNGYSIALPTAMWTKSACENAFKQLPNVGSVECGLRTNGRNGGYQILLSFLSFPMFPRENNIYTHNGKPNIRSFSCDTSGVSGLAKCDIFDVLGNKYPEYDYCSNRGVCNFNTGECICIKGYTNANCGTVDKAYRDESALLSRDILNLRNARLNFQGNILRLSTTLNETEFNYLTCTDLNHDLENPVYQITGFGDMHLNLGGMVVRALDGRGGMTIKNGGLAVTGGVTVHNAGLSVAGGVTMGSGTMTLDAGALYVTGGVSITSGGLAATGGTTITGAGLRLTRGGLVVNRNGMTVSAGGFFVGPGVSVRTGGFAVTGGVTIWSFGMDVEDTGVTVFSGGLNTAGGLTISSSGLGVTGGVSVTAGGLRVVDQSDVAGGLYLYSALSILSDGLQITDGLSVTNNGIAIAGGLTVNSGTFSASGGVGVAGGFTVHSGGAAITGGVTVYSDGVSLSTGSVTISSGNLRVTSGSVTVGTDGTDILGGVSVLSSGFSAAGGLSMGDGGLFVTGTGLTITGGAAVTGGLSITTSGARVSGGLTVDSAGVIIPSVGVTVSSNLLLENGLTVSSGGSLAVTNGLSVTTDGMSVSGGGLLVSADGFSAQSSYMTVTSGGLDITGGMTSYSAMNITGGLSATGGVRVTGGVTVGSDGMALTGDVTIGSDGMSVTGSATFATLRATGGVSLYSSDAVVGAGLSVDSIGVRILSSQVTVANNGVRVSTGNLDVTTLGASVFGGVTVTAGGVRVLNTGLAVTGGLSITGGLTVDGSITVTSGSLFVTPSGASVGNGVTINNNLNVDGWLSVGNNVVSVGGTALFSSGLSGGVATTTNMQVTTSATLTSTSVVTITSTGLELTSTGTLSVQGGLLVSAGGVSTLNSMTVQTNGMLVLTDGVTVTNNGIRVSTGGMTVTSMNIAGGGMSLTDGLSVSSGGLIATANGVYATGGATVYSGGVVITNGGLSVSGGLHVTAFVSVAGDMFVRNGMTVEGVIKTQVKSISDRRLKKNIRPIVNSLERVKKLKGVYFHWVQRRAEERDSGAEQEKVNETGVKFPKERQVGVIAQDLQKVLPEAVVSLNEGKYLGVRYSDIIPLLVEATKELGEVHIAKEKQFIELQQIARQLNESVAYNDNESPRLETWDDVAAVLAEMDQKLQLLESKVKR